jgi:molybdopterin synthase catalytic subunit
MDPTPIMERIKSHPDYPKVGMILCHRGVVRSFARDGRPVSGLRVAVDRVRLEELLQVQRRKPGIVDIQIEIAADQDLAAGQDVMLLVVAGDFRENVIRTLEETLNAVKTTVTRKTEFPL